MQKKIEKQKQRFNELKTLVKKAIKQLEVLIIALAVIVILIACVAATIFIIATKQDTLAVTIIFSLICIMGLYGLKEEF